VKRGKGENRRDRLKAAGANGLAKSSLNGFTQAMILKNAQAEARGPARDSGEGEPRFQVRPCGAGDFGRVARLLAQLWPDKPLDQASLRSVFERGLGSEPSES
jgi:hypothetical protein